MEYQKEITDGCARIRIEGEMTIYEAAELRAIFLQGFDETNGLILDLNAVTECDTAGIQLMCSAHKTAKAHQKCFLVEGLSESVVNALSTSGISMERILSAGEGA